MKGIQGSFCTFIQVFKETVIIKLISQAYLEDGLVQFLLWKDVVVLKGLVLNNCYFLEDVVL